ncbi:MAG: hypothetical protein AB8G96_17260, partial [Phycisphaerales bacterium]
AAATLAAAVLAAPALAGPEPIRVLSWDQSRSRQCDGSNGPIDHTFGTGNQFGLARAALASAANFGPGGIVPRPVELLPGVGCIDVNELVGVDVVLLTTDNESGVTACELAALGAFVEQGGGVLYLENSAIRWLSPLVGSSDVAPAGSGPVSVAAPASPVINGPFGVVTPGFQFNFHRTSPDVGPIGEPLLATTDTVAARFVLGDGVIVAINDDEFAGDITTSPCAASQMLEGPRRPLFLNAFAAVVPADGFSFDPPAAIADANCDGAVTFDDVLAVLASWGPCERGCETCLADFDESGNVDFADLLAVLATFGSRG